jgi:hypothetical protein
MLQATMPTLRAVGNCCQVCPDRCGPGSDPSTFRIAQTVEAPPRRPSPANSLWMRRNPQPGLSTASRSATARRSASARTPPGVDGRPGGRVAVVVNRRATRRRCHPRIVPGLTSMLSRRVGGSRSVRASMIARSAYVNRGRRTLRCTAAS